MADLSLAPLTEEDAPALFAFEVENRAWFETWVGPRPHTYWEVTSLAQVIRAQLVGDDAMFLIRRGDEILGRLNLTAREGGVAQLGYRVGECHVGQGVASAAVAQALECARKLGLWALEARVANDNPASRGVLEKNGFLETGQIEFAGHQMTLFRRDLD
ncbi:GNAT family N-acetyltransferase [Aliiroseovarius crassostreae]|uniref:GNAT family N-acetyltransferase n=1 Tax=Aliiroseovarius crassostreae TaxID=154981 RepID=A0A9Q9HAS0_9RHOB|nr:GNAT family N-acetyltransferase [Aliiroseovarius crassostreae]UWP95841.1 GNAT family N-acetyltransferase [Aliiroseovarius crassostreae]